jgi:hypothetical protein
MLRIFFTIGRNDKYRTPLQRIGMNTCKIKHFDDDSQS